MKDVIVPQKKNVKPSKRGSQVTDEVLMKLYEKMLYLYSEPPTQALVVRERGPSRKMTGAAAGSRLKRPVLQILFCS